MSIYVCVYVSECVLSEYICVSVCVSECVCE